MSKERIVIIDYGSGNIRSAAKAFEHVIANEAIEARVLISGQAEDVLSADRLVLPGQGAFGDCLENLMTTEGMIEALSEAVLNKGTPFLGICVGMQLLATKGLENGEFSGLNWVPGQVVPLKERVKDDTLKIPHMGWNTLQTPAQGAQDNRHFVLRSTESSEAGPHHYYFVHSYMFECEYNHHILATADYGVEFAAAVGRDNIVGVQFHPEKSQAAGLRLISDFVHWKP
ncbi:MAG: imidazole glycerol phosphate synthase subunit HisH [Alphaproteobacteria bacterium]|nr:imidazole glycerol phosphate synthase subunit HisH [Alphaproteobacteria bacterium]